MRVIVFAPYGGATGHHEVDLEMAVEHLKRRDEVHVVTCQAEMRACDLNPHHDPWICLRCKGIASQSFMTIGIAPENLHTLQLKEVLPASEIPHFATIDDLRQFSWRGKPAGFATAAGIISATRDSKPDVVFYRDYLVRLLQTYASIYVSLSERIRAVNAEKIYLFNGRVAVFNAAFWASQDAKIDTIVTERPNYREYVLIPNATCNDLPYAKKHLVETTQRMQRDPQAVAIASNWFKQNRAGNKDLLCNYLLEQKIGQLPEGWNPNRHNIAIFISSEDEVAGSPGFENLYFSSQTEAIEYVLSQLRHPNIHFYLRVHPNLKGVKCSQARELAALSAPNLTVIPAADIVDSYALLEAANTVLTFGSTIGVEACYWGKPSVLAGRAWYEDTGACYTITRREDLIELLAAPLKPKSQMGALAYAYWISTRGTPFQHVQTQHPITLNEPSYRGIPLRPPPGTRALLFGQHLLVRQLKRLESVKRKVFKKRVA